MFVFGDCINSEDGKANVCDILIPDIAAQDLHAMPQVFVGLNAIFSTETVCLRFISSSHTLPSPREMHESTKKTLSTSWAFWVLCQMCCSVTSQVLHLSHKQDDFALHCLIAKGKVRPSSLWSLAGQEG